MAHDGSSDDESAYLDAHDTAEDDSALSGSKLPLEIELSPSCSSVCPPKEDSPASSSRPKAASAAAATISLTIHGESTDGLNEVPRNFWDARRRTQSDGNLQVEGSTLDASIAVNSAAPGTFLASPAHSESALMKMGVTPPPPPISIRPAADTKPNGFMAIGESFLAGVADFARLKSPRGTVQKVHVVYPTPGPLFVDLYSRDDGTGARVKGFRRKPDGSMADAEGSGRVYPGDELVSINAVDVNKMTFADIITTAKEATFPLTLTFQCYQTNREEHDKLIQQKPPERKHSSGPLPPISPSSGAGWGARLSLMTRSGSFDQTSSGTSLGNGAQKSPSSHSTSLETNGGKFGFSLGKVGTDGVKKNLFRIMGNKPSRPEEDKNVVKGWMNDLALKPHKNSSGGRRRKTPATISADVLHSTPIVAVTTSGRFVGVLDEDVNEFALTWFRKTLPEMGIQQIKGVKRCPYFPSVDDVGAILSLQCESLRFPLLKRVVEMSSPLVLDPAVGNTVDVFLEAGAGSFSATLASNEHDSFQIKISDDSVKLVKISEKGDEGGVVVEATYSAFLQVLLDPGDQLRFTLKVQEFGGFLGNRKADVCDLKKRLPQLGTLSCFFLVAQNRQNRDIMTLLIRKFRARVLTPEEEEQAQVDERNLFMDPAFVVTVAASPPLTASRSVGLSSGAISPANNSTATGETASSAGSPSTATTPLSGATSSPAAGKTRPARLQSEASFSSIASARLSDLVGLEPDDADNPSQDRGADMATPAATPPRSAITLNKNGFPVSSNGDISFVEGRLAAQDKEIVMLREKLASMSILLKAAEQENKQVTASLEVKDNRIELQQMKLHQLEKLPGQCESQAREIQSLRTKLEDEERRYAQCRDELQQVSSAAAKLASEMRDQGAQTESQFLDGNGLAGIAMVSASDWERDAWSGTVTIVSASDLQQNIKDQQAQIAQLQDEHVKLVGERNMFRAKSLELSKELRRLVGANNNRPLDDLESQLAERSNLQSELVSVKADAKSTADKLAELKSVLENVSDKDKGAKRLVAQNVELQRTVHQLQDSLSESRDQVDVVKKINSALASRLRRLQPDETRGSVGEHAPTSPLSEFISDDEDDDEEEEDEELKDGIAAFRRSLVGK